MRSFTKIAVIAAVTVALGFGAYAELQNVLVSGSLRIRGNVYEMDDSVTYADIAYIEQRTRLGVTADFTDNVSTFIELDSYDVWGEDFRSEYITGVDFRSASVDDVEVYQAYIQVDEMWDTPLFLRVGRQEVSLGSEWLAGVNNAAAFFPGLSFDATTIGYVTDMVDIKAWAAKLGEAGSEFGDDDLDFYGIYGSYLGLEDITIDAYWMFVRDDNFATAIADTDLHTIGLRGAGTVGAFDFEAEAAYQFGEYDLPDFLWWDNDLDIDAFGGHFQVGYTFDANWTPSVFLGLAYFEGADQEDEGFFDRLFGNDDDDVAFNRLFSNWEYSEFLENTAMSNVLILRGGASVAPTEALSVSLLVSWFDTVEERDGWDFLWWSENVDSELGLELGLYADYQYSDDLVFRAGWAHFFADDGMDEGNLIVGNGFLPILGDDDDDYDYLFLESEISF